MLRLTIHAGPLKSTSRFNLVAALDVGYEKLAPVADYKATLFVAGVGVTSPVMLRGYARWSASLWDLLARALALTLSPDAARPIEEVPPVAPGGKRSAFATGLSGLIEHLPGGDELRRTTLGTVAVEQAKRRCTYRALFTEDTMPDHATDTFSFAPKRLNAAELLLHAMLIRLHGRQDQLPYRPALARAGPVVVDGKPYIPIHLLPEPARTGFLRWLACSSEAPRALEGHPDGVAPEPSYLTFLKVAV